MEYYQNCSVLGCVTQCSQSAAHSYEQFLQVLQQIGFVTLSHYAMHRGLAQSCIIVTWWSGLGGIQALSERPTSFLQCVDTVGLVI